MKRKSVNVNWTEETFNYSGHAAIRNFMVETTNDLKEVGDFNLQKPTAKEQRIENMRRKVIYVNICEETFDLQYKRVFGVSDKTPSSDVVPVEPSITTEVETPVVIQEESDSDPWTTRFRM